MMYGSKVNLAFYALWVVKDMSYDEMHSEYIKPKT